MAGVGFKLTKYFSKSNVSGNLRGALYSVIISSGPWLITVLAVAFVTLISQRFLGQQDLKIFRAIICYTYAVSLIIFGFIEMPVTRYLADKLFIHDVYTFKNLYLFIGAIITAILTIFGLVFYSITFPEDFLMQLLGTYFLVFVALIWLAMIFLSAAKNFHPIIISFLLGGLISVGLSMYLGQEHGLVGCLFGFVAGQAFTALSLGASLFLEFKGQQYHSYEITNYFKNNKTLVFVGLFYYLGIWADKAVFWYTDVGQKVVGLLYTNQYYDTAMFIAYLSIVPTLAVFLVKVETDFYIQYSYYFNSILNKKSLPFLNQARGDIVRSLREAISSLYKIQVAVTLPLWIFAEQIIKVLNLPGLMEPIFKFGIIGAFLQGNFLIFNIILLYFERSRLVLKNYSIFFVTNFAFSLISVNISEKVHGLGYVASCFLVAIISYTDLNKTLNELHMRTFLGQSLDQRDMVDFKL
ncbi:MAG: exopolysaccharide Pel transporter PelG [Oligoflexia bacterium]|nr:exopolysaccharide Pel transporter PelG [Oligoflexia bacterium]